MDRKYKIAVVPGDGIGPEVINEGLKVLETLSEKEGFSYELKNYPFSADYYLETEISMPEEVFDELREMDAIYVGAIGDPRVETGFLERAIIGGIRFKLDLYVNLRPIKLYAEHLCPLKDKKPEDIDILVIRENTEDVYTGLGGFFKKGTEDEVALQEMIFTRKGVERVIRYAFQRAKERKKKLTLVDKANAVRAMDLWQRIFDEVGEEYPDVEREHAYVDATCMWMVLSPERFDCIVVPNMFGDIITDLGAALQGGMGIAASGNIHPGRVSMFEPVHGSAPKYRGKGVANPLAAILTLSIMLGYLGEKEASGKIEKAVSSLLASRKIPSLSTRSGLKTNQIGDLVVEEIKSMH